MIQLDLPTLLVVYLTAFLAMIVVPWAWHEWTRRQPRPIDRKKALECPICLHAFIAQTEGKQDRCPRCSSWVRIA